MSQVSVSYGSEGLWRGAGMNNECLQLPETFWSPASSVQLPQGTRSYTSHRAHLLMLTDTDISLLLQTRSESFRKLIFTAPCSSVQARSSDRSRNYFYLIWLLKTWRNSLITTQSMFLSNVCIMHHCLWFTCILAMVGFWHFLSFSALLFCSCTIFYCIYIYAFSRRFYPRQLAKEEVSNAVILYMHALCSILRCKEEKSFVMIFFVQYLVTCNASEISYNNFYCTVLSVDSFMHFTSALACVLINHMWY